MANYKTLTYGTTGEDVKKLQQSLNDRGANLDVDGIYGEKTRSAVRSYQQSNGLAVDGIAGSETLGHLYGTGLANTQDTQATTGSVGPQAAPSATNSQAVTPQVSTQRTPEQAWQDYLNREVFSYDPETDPLYQSYRKQYTDAGRLAMEDTMGMASTLTGGYGNSYAQTAGQQTYNAYLQQLAGVMPELYGAAYDRYRAEGEALYNEIVLTEQRRENAYNKLVSLMSLGYDPTDEELAAAGLTRPQANTLRSHYTPSYTPGNKYSAPAGYTKEDIERLQRMAGITVDGIWGPETQKAYVSGYTKDSTPKMKAVEATLKKPNELSPHELVAFGSYENYIAYTIMSSDLSDDEIFILTDNYGVEDATVKDLAERGMISFDEP